MPYYLSYDIGTTSLKTALVADDGRVLGVHTAEYALKTPKPDWAEMAPGAYWQAAIDGTRAVLATAPAAEIRGIGFSSQGQTFIPLDPSGTPLHDAIVWVDNRAQGIADQWESEWLSREEYHGLTGYPWIPAGLTAFKLGWMARHVPHAHRAWKFLCLPDYLIYRMTGETATDFNIAQMSGLYDLRTGDWAPRVLEAADVTPAQLPRILAPGTVAGHLHATAAADLGIPAGVPVCLGCNDQLAGALGAGNVVPGIASATTGTSLAVVATTATFIHDARVFGARHAVPGAFYAMSFTGTSAIILKWFRDLCAPGESYDNFLAGVEAIPPGCDGLTLFPHFIGTGMPTFNAKARGAFVGLTLGHTRAHMARAIMESCACMLRECLSCLADHGGQLTAVRALGGAARSDLWLQMKADMLGVPVERPACSDAASLGAAMLAAVGAGNFPTLADASAAWYRHDREFTPNPARYAAYDEVYGRYLELYERLYG